MNTTHTNCSCGCTGSHACDCCTGPHISTPQTVFNPAGLSAIQRRAGTWGSFRSTMQARLSSVTDFPALKNLTTREPDDPSIAFLDAAAVVCDVLTFYSERFANEGYLRTATQRRSLMELGKLVGYRPRPGVAASAWLAFTLDTDYAITIPAGTRVQSVPSAPGETAQTFETSGDLTARYELNAMPVRQSVPQEISPANVLNVETIWLKGTGLNLKAGDMLLFVFPEDEAASTPRKIHTVTEDAAAQRTTVKLEVEKLSAAYYVPVLRKYAQALRRTLPDGWIVAERPWAKNVAEALATFDRGLGSDTSLLGIEKLFAPPAAGSPGLPQHLAKVVEAAAKAKSLTTEIGDRAGWKEAITADLRGVLGKAAIQEALLVAVIDKLTTLDTTDATQIDLRKAIAAQIAALLDEGTTTAGAVQSCFPPAITALRELRAVAAQAALATPATWNSFGLGGQNVPLSTKRTAVDAFGGNATAARQGAATLLKISDDQLASGGISATAAAATLNDSGTFQTAITASPLAIQPLLTAIRAELSAKWLARETTMRAKLSAGTVTDTTLGAAVTFNSGKVDALSAALPGNFNIRTTEFLSMADATAANYDGVREDFSRISSAGSQATALAAQQARFQSESFSGLQRSILLLTGRYKSVPEIAGEMSALELAAAGATASAGLAPLRVRLSASLVKVEEAAALTPGTKLDRLRAEMEILDGQVAASPSGLVTAAPVSTSAAGADLQNIVSGSTLLAPPAPGDPLSVSRSLSSFVSGGTGGAASDAVSRLAGRLAGSSDDDLFAAWRLLNTGKPAVEVYAMRVMTPVFGSGAPMRFGKDADNSFDKRFDLPGGDGDWGVVPGDLGTHIRLDGEQSKVVRDSYLVIERPLMVPVARPLAPQAVAAAAPPAAAASAAAPPSAGSGGVSWVPVIPVLVMQPMSFPLQLTGLVFSSAAPQDAVIRRNGTDYREALYTRVRRAEEVLIAPHSAYSLSGKATTVKLLTSENWGDDPVFGFDLIRRTRVYAASELLTLAEVPVDRTAGLVKAAPVEGSTLRSSENPFSESTDVLMLDALYQGIAAGHRIIVAGERAGDVSARPVREYALVSKVEHALITAMSNPDAPLPGDTPHTRITLSEPLQYQYKRDTVTVYGNVAEATHGETKRETLGSGNARAASQRFAMRSVPVTYLAAATTSGAESTAELRVDRVLWKEVEQFTNAGPDDRVYLLDIADDGSTYAVFGDGKQGARLPTGAENVAAVYRQGIGQGGNVGAESLSTVLDRPLGLKGVINPLAASGGADRDSAEDIRTNAPLPLLALDRLVSVSDYGAFSRAFAGIGKAEAAALGGAGGSMVHVTIAGQADAAISEDSSLMTSLTQALITLGDPLLPVRVQSRELLVLLLSAGVRIAPEYAWADVEPALRAALLAAFGFDRRAPGQDVFLSEVIAVMQRVTGVDFVDVDSFGGISEKKLDGVTRRALTPEELETEIGKLIASVPQERVAVELAGWDTPDVLRPAQLALFLSDMPETLTLNQLAS